MKDYYDDNLIPPNDEQLLTFFKALADANRLKIIGLLSQQPYSVEQLAALLNLRPPTVSHHLKLLSEAGLVSARAESYYNLYQLESGVLEQIAKHLGAQDKLPSMAAEVDLEAYDRKVSAGYPAARWQVESHSCPAQEA